MENYEVEIFKLYKAKKFDEMNDAIGAWAMSENSYKPYLANLKIIIDVFDGDVDKFINDENNFVYTAVIKNSDFKGSPASVCATLFTNAGKRTKNPDEARILMDEVGEFMTKLKEKLEFYVKNPYIRAKDYAAYRNNMTYGDFEKLFPNVEKEVLNAINIAYLCNFWNFDDLPDAVFYGRWAENSKNIDKQCEKLLIGLDENAEQYMRVAEELEKVKSVYVDILAQEKSFIEAKDKLVSVCAQIEREKKNLAEFESVPEKKGLFSKGANAKRQANIDNCKAKTENLEEEKKSLESIIKGYEKQKKSLENAGEYGKLFVEYLDIQRKRVTELETLLKDYGAMQSTPDDFALYNKQIESVLLKKHGGMNSAYWSEMSKIQSDMTRPGGLADYFTKRSSLSSLMRQLDRAREEYNTLKNIFKI